MWKDKIDIKLIRDLFLFTGASLSMYYLISQLLGEDGVSVRSLETKKKANSAMKKLKAANPSMTLDLNSYEKAVLASVVMPEDINVRFKDIGGLEDIIDELREAVLYPLTEPELYEAHSSLLQAPKGVLLYGPPGCGKTMLAKALAAESGANFLSIRLSSIMDKWYGESNKLVDAIFSLANKLQPCIIFIDEIDSFLRQRQSMDHESTAMLKAEFMTLWDGLTSSGRVLVLGATNRPNDIDAAFMRRMPKRFAVSLPDYKQREKIISVLLKDVELDPKEFSLAQLVDQTQNLSGSDIKELCRNAAMNAMREYIKRNFKDGKKIDQDVRVRVRPLKNSDFFNDAASDRTLPGNRVATTIIASTVD